MKCPNCNSECSASDKFCQHCGQKLPEIKICARCGAEIVSQAKFCEKCGSPVPQEPKQTTSDKTGSSIGNDRIDNPTSETHSAALTDSVAPEQPGSDLEQPDTPIEEPTQNTEPPSDDEPEYSEGYYETEESSCAKPRNPLPWILLAFVLIIAAGGFIYWMVIHKSPRQEEEVVVAGIVADSDTMVRVEDVEQDYNYSDSETACDPVESYENIETFPDASDIESMQAYDIYPDYMTDEPIGDNWCSSNVVSFARNEGLINYYMSAKGEINGYEVGFEAILASDNRIYGRYMHSNGTKLDVNGVIDSYGNLIIKLGHGSATSYWVLKNRSSSDNCIGYDGTWGRKSLPSWLQITYHYD